MFFQLNYFLFLNSQPSALYDTSIIHSKPTTIHFSVSYGLGTTLIMVPRKKTMRKNKDCFLIC